MAYPVDAAQQVPFLTGTPAVRAQLPPGDAGVAAKLGILRQQVMVGVTHPAVLAAAQVATRGVDGRDTVALVDALRSYLQSHIRFLYDPRGVETFRTPAHIAHTIAATGEFAGDCDDLALYAATLARAVGLPARFVVLGFQGARGPFAHILTEVGTPLGWVDLDVTARPSVAPSRRWVVEA